ncbi:MAG: hypothetical protein WCV85_01570 [Patescibacteria group bacterium]
MPRHDNLKIPAISFAVLVILAVFVVGIFLIVIQAYIVGTICLGVGVIGGLVLFLMVHFHHEERKASHEDFVEAARSMRVTSPTAQWYKSLEPFTVVQRGAHTYQLYIAHRDTKFGTRYAVSIEKRQPPPDDWSASEPTSCLPSSEGMVIAFQNGKELILPWPDAK